MTATVSACLLACDEEDVLGRCLDTLSWVDEIVVVVDAKSSDGSEKIARERAHRVEVRRYEGDIEQKSYCAGLATGDWVFIVDPDEVVTPELASEVRRVVADPSGREGFEVNRLTWHLGRWIRHGDFFPDWTLRLFRPATARWVGANPHGRVVVPGRVGRIEGDGAHLEHYSYRDLADQIARIQFFSDESARALYARGQRAGFSHLVLRPPARFLRAYLLKGGFRDGMAGFVIACLTGFHVFLKYAKLWELQRSGRREPGGQPRIDRRP